MTSSNGNIFRVTGHLCGERSPVNSPHKGQWCGALKFSLICAWTNGWANTPDAGDLRRHRARYDVIVILKVSHHLWQYIKYNIFLKYTYVHGFIALCFRLHVVSFISWCTRCAYPHSTRLTYFCHNNRGIEIMRPLNFQIALLNHEEDQFHQSFTNV